MINSQEFPEKLVIFDGHCVICNGSVRTIAANDVTGSIRFTHSETLLSKRLSNEWPSYINPSASVVFIDNGNVYTMSDAVIQIAKYLRFPYNLLRFYKILPKGIRDKLYRFVANNRYRIFKKREHCILPGRNLRSKIIE